VETKTGMAQGKPKTANNHQEARKKKERFFRRAFREQNQKGINFSV
jgi:hypothetical protein